MRKYFRLGVAAACLLSLSTSTFAQNIPADLRLSKIAEQLPGGFAIADVAEQTLLIASRNGTVRTLQNGVLSATASLSFDAELSCNYAGSPIQTGFSEAAGGLLGMALDPTLGVNRKFYFSYADSNADIMLAQFLTVRDQPTQIDRASCTILLRIDRDVAPSTLTPAFAPLAFGLDGQLYLGTDDGGLFGDSCQRAQTLSPAVLASLDANNPACRGDPDFLKSRGNPNSRVLLGKVLRINPNTSALAPHALCGVQGMASYSAGNAFTGLQCPEVVMYGVHQPVQLGFDLRTGWVFVSDAGTSTDEVSFGSTNPPKVPSGINLGWPCFEAESNLNTCFGLTLAQTRDPVLLFPHTPANRMVGGFSYRGPIGELRGSYIFTDSAGLLYFVNIPFTVAFGASIFSENWPPPVTRTAAQLGVVGAFGGITGIAQDRSRNVYVFERGGALYRLSTPAALFDDGFDGFGGENPAPNRGPNFTSQPVLSALGGALYSYAVTAFDADGDALEFELMRAPPGMQINAVTGNLSWTPSLTAPAQLGIFDVELRVRDDKGAEAIQRFALDVRAPPGGGNNPPRISSTAPVNALLQVSYSYAVQANDPDGDPLSYELVQFPVGMTISSAGIISFLPTQVGNVAVRLRVLDNRSGSVEQSYQLNVTAAGNRPPVFSSTPVYEVQQGLAYVYTASATDPESTPIRYSLVNPPTGMLINASTGQITWPTTSVAIGTYAVLVRATDTPASGTPASSDQRFTVAVNAPNAEFSYLGREFWFVFQKSLTNDFTVFAPADSPYRFRQVHIIAPTGASGTVSNVRTNFSQTFSIPAGGQTTVALPWQSMEETLTGAISQYGVHVTADQPVRVLAMHLRNAAADSTLVAPIGMLGLRYTAFDHYGFSPIPFGGGQNNVPGQISIVATQDNTQVRVQAPADPRYANQPEIVSTLNQGESQRFVYTFSFAQSNYFGLSLSGTTISSNKPVAVFGGSECANTPLALPACEFMTEQVWPDRLLGTRFIGVPVATRRKGELYRIVAAESDTEVKFNGRLVTRLARGEFWLGMREGAQLIETSRPASVLQMTTSEALDHGLRPLVSGDNELLADPSLVNLPPLTHALRHYWLARAPLVPVVNPFYNGNWVHEYVHVAMPKSALGTLRLNGQAQALKDLVNVPNALETLGAEWLAGWFELPTGVLQLSAAEPFVATQAGFAETQAYSHAVGYLITDEVRAARISATPSSQNPAVGDQACVDLRAFDSSNRPLGYVRFDVTSAERSAEHRVLVADGAGTTRYCYTAALPGKDVLTVRAGVQSTEALVFWRARTPNEENRPPLFEAVPALSLRATRYDEPVVAIDPEGLPLSYSLLEAPNGALIDSATGQLRFTPVVPLDRNPVDYNFTVQARDAGGLTAVQRFTVHTIFSPLWQLPYNVNIPVSSDFFKGPVYRGGDPNTSTVRTLLAPENTRIEPSPLIYSFGSPLFGSTPTTIVVSPSPQTPYMDDNRVLTPSVTSPLCDSAPATLGSLAAHFQSYSSEAFYGNTTVGRFVDTNGDNLVNASDAAFALSSQFGTLKAVNLANGIPLFEIPDFARTSWRGALADVTGDAKPEFLTMRPVVNQRFLAAISSTGTVVWQSSTDFPRDTTYYSSIEVADLDGNGTREIFVDGAVFNLAGVLQWRFNPAPNVFSTRTDELMPAIADLDGDGKKEVLYRNEVRRFDGSLLWNLGTAGNSEAIVGYAVANLDSDSAREVVAVVQQPDGTAQVWSFEADGQRRFGPITARAYIAPTIADFNGDGSLDIAVVGAGLVLNSMGADISRYTPMDAPVDKTPLVLDLDQNGRFETVQTGNAGPSINGLVVKDVLTGDVIMQQGFITAGFRDLNLIDVDGDGQTEFVHANRAIAVFAPNHGRWPTLSRDRVSFADELDGVNSYGLAALPSTNGMATRQVDFWVGPASMQLQPNSPPSGERVSLTASVANLGNKAQLTPLRVSFYSGRKTQGGRLMGAVSVPRLRIGERLNITLADVNKADLVGWTYTDVEAITPITECSLANNFSGSHAIEAEVGDSSRAERTDRILFAPVYQQRYAAPALLNSADAPRTATVGRPYRFKPQWGFTAPGVSLAHVLPAALTTAAKVSINAATGQLEWTPTANQVGVVSLQFAVYRGDEPSITQANQAVAVTVAPSPGAAPYFTSTPTLGAVVNTPYSYNATAADPDSTTLSFSLVAGPSTMTVSTGGAVRWTPQTADIGKVPVQIRVSDGVNTTTQDFVLSVSATANQPPVISGFDRIEFGSVFEGTLLFIASDPEGKPLTYRLVSYQNNYLLEQPNIAANAFFLRIGADAQSTTGIMEVSDGVNTVNAPFTLNAWNSDEPLFIDLSPRLKIANAGEQITVTVATRGASSGARPVLTVDGAAVPLSAEGTATLSAGLAGRRQLQATITQGGVTKTARAQIIVKDLADTTLPSVNILNILEETIITAPIPVRGLVQDPNILEWVLQLEDSSRGDEVIPLLRGTNTGADILLGTFDPTLIENGAYVLALVATDTGGNIQRSTRAVQLEGGMKIGHFAITLEDASVALKGLNLQLSRTYDSRRRNILSDFGFGWTLGHNTVRVRESKPLGRGWRVVVTGLNICVRAVNEAGIVSLTMPDGMVQSFRMRPVPECSFFANPEIVFAYDPINKSDGSLVSTGGPYRLQGLDLLDSDGAIADPDTYIYTTPQKVSYSVQQSRGLFRIADSNENVLDFTYNGIFQSSNLGATVGIRYSRLPDGRIDAIAKPDGTTIRYRYNANKELISVLQQDNDAANYGYYRDHYLRRTGFSDGRNGFNNILSTQTFDDDGRIVSITDALGKSTEMRYRLGDNAQEVKDRAGNTTVYQYDERGNVRVETNAENEVTIRTYDPEDNVLTERDGTLRTTTWTVNRFGNKLTEHENGAPLDKIAIMGYDVGTQQLTDQTDAEGRVVMKAQYAPNQDKIYWSENGMGERTNFGYASPLSDSLVGMTDPEQNITRFVRDNLDRVTHQFDALGHKTSMGYDGMGRVLTETRQRKNSNGVLVDEVTTHEYDSTGNRTKTIHPDGEFETWRYDARNLMTSHFDVLNRETRTGYDANGRKVNESMDFDGNGVAQKFERWEYDEMDRETLYVDPEGHATKKRYDKVGRLVKTIFADETPATDTDNPFSSTVYDDAGRVESQTDELNQTTRFEYDAQGRQEKIIFPDLTFATTKYDYSGRKLSSTDPDLRTTKYEYDIAGRLLFTILPDTTPGTDDDNPRMGYGYDKNGRKTSMTDEMNRKTVYVYDEKGQLTEVKLAAHTANPVSTTYGYDEVGGKIRQTDANNHITKWQFDSRGREVERRLPMGQSESKRYNSLGQMNSMTNFIGQSTDFVYDVQSRLKTITHPDGTATHYTYYKNGLKKTMTEGTKVWSWTYDVRDRLKSITEPDQLPLSPTNPHTIEYEYDAVGNRTLMKTATQSVVYEFDNRNRLEEVRARKTGDVADQVTTYGYTDAGARDRQTHPNGTTVKYIYNPRHQLKEMLHKTAAGVLLLGITYQLDASGLRTEIAETGQTTRVANYEYDAQKRLTLESVKASPTGAFIRSQVYEYDPVGNRRVETKTVGATVEAITSTYDRNDRLKTATSVNSTVTYQYDANGRLESQVTAPASGTTTTVAYGWDSRDRMVSSTSTSGTQSSTTKFSYDPDGTRIGQTQNAGTPQAKTIRYLVDRNQPYAQVVEERVFTGEATAPNIGALTNIYAFGDDLLTNTSCGAASTESNCAAADLRVLHYDGLGSTRFLSNSSGATTDKYAYEAFGELDASGSSGAFANNYKFTGEQLDPGLGFYYLRARYFNPGTGGFVSMDSYGGNGRDPISLNKYLYANANPVMFVDPSGKITLGEVASLASIVSTISNISIGSAYGIFALTDVGGDVADCWVSCMDRKMVRAALATGMIAQTSAGSIPKILLGYEVKSGANNFTSLARRLSVGKILRPYTTVFANWLKRSAAGKVTGSAANVVYVVSSSYLFYSALTCAFNSKI